MKMSQPGVVSSGVTPTPMHYDTTLISNKARQALVNKLRDNAYVSAYVLSRDNNQQWTYVSRRLPRVLDDATGTYRFFSFLDQFGDMTDMEKIIYENAGEPPPLAVDIMEEASRRKFDVYTKANAAWLDKKGTKK